MTLDQLVERFRDLFGRTPSHMARAPGRVNILGEHTDYNGGLVLPIAIDRETICLGATRDDGVIRIQSVEIDQPVEVFPGEAIVPGEPIWGRYVLGIVHGARMSGLDIGGFDALVHTTIPVGGGLSSSAALEVAMATLMEELVGRRLDPFDKALLAQRAEHEFVGVPCGLMDQLIAVFAQKGHALLIECKDHTMSRVPLPKGLHFSCMSSGIHHELAASEYATRQDECVRAARELGVASLREVSPDDLDGAPLPETLLRRARHVATEIERVRDGVTALEVEDLTWLGRLVDESHDSLRDDFEVSLPEVDDVVRDMRGRDGVIGARMVGGGFGGVVLGLSQAPLTGDSIVELISADGCSGSRLA